MPAFVLLTALTVSCAPSPTFNAPSPSIAHDLHLATGHVPPDCYVFGNLDVTIVIEDSGFSPSCVVADGDVALDVKNVTGENASFWAVDSPEGAQSALHLRIELEVPAGGEARLDRIGDLVSKGEYPFFLTERLETHWGRLEVRSDAAGS
jgi:hypothetical protein